MSNEGRVSAFSQSLVPNEPFFTEEGGEPSDVVLVLMEVKFLIIINKQFP
jgi:hypothetical protein